MHLRVVPFVLVLTAVPIVASEPGQRLECSDWVFSEPGIICAETLVTSNVSPGRGVRATMPKCKSANGR